MIFKRNTINEMKTENRKRDILRFIKNITNEMKTENKRRKNILRFSKKLTELTDIQTDTNKSTDTDKQTDRQSAC